MKIENCTVVFKLFPSKSSKKISETQYKAIAENGWNTEYCPRRFHAIIMRFHPVVGNNKIIAALLFRSGKVVMTGVPKPGH